MPVPDDDAPAPVDVLVLHSAPEEVLPVLAAGCPGARLHAADRPAAVAPALERVRPAVVFSIKHSGFPGPAHRLAVAAPSVRWLHVGGSGTDHLGTWDARRLAVTSSAGVLAPALAEMALGALFSLALGLGRFQDDQRAARWAPRRFRPLAGRTLLVVGLGHTGRELALRARALGMTVVATRRCPAPHPAAHEVHPPEALADLLPRADVLSLHVPLVPATRGLIGAAELARLPPGALVLNSARGPVLDRAALVAALDRGHLAGAWLDVFDTEPLPAADPLWHHPRLLLTPHCADQCADFPARFAARFCALWPRFRAGAGLPALVPPAPGPGAGAAGPR